MSVPAVQSHGVETVHPAAPVTGAAPGAPTRGHESPRVQDQQDRVTVSDHARRLAAGTTGATGAKAPGEVELKLDFRKLRELATAQNATKSPAEPA